METREKWIVIGVIFGGVSAIIAVLSYLSGMPLSTMMFIVRGLLVVAITVLTLLIVFSRKRRKEGGSTCIFQRYEAVIGTFILITTILIYSSINRLPDAKTVTETARTVGSELAGMKMNMALFSKGMDNIIHTIIRYQKEPEAARNRVYEDALKQAAAKSYVVNIPQRDYYVTVTNKRGDKRLLTRKEADILEKVLKEIFERSNKRDQISLMNEVLSDIRVTEELWKPKERKVELSELDIIGVVGGYIGEIVLKY